MVPALGIPKTDRKGKSAVFLLILIAIAGIPAVAFGVSKSTSLSFIQSVSVIETAGTVGLSAVLAYLYLDIRGIQENQEELMRVEYEPEIKATISSGSEGYPVVLVKNTGLATALELEVHLMHGDGPREAEHPFLGAGDAIEYPVYEDGGPLSADEIIDRIEAGSDKDNDAPYESRHKSMDEKLICAVTCRDVKGDVHGFQDTFELTPAIEQLEDYAVRSDVDALNEIEKAIKDVQDELREMNNDML